MKRRLAAILAIDVVGYSRLMEADEMGTVGRMQRRLSGLMEPGIGRHSGRIFKVMGDGLLAEFPSAIDAVECAAGLQAALGASNDDAPEGQAIEARMAVTLGDVVADGEDLLGEAVNIAARLEKLAEPGGLLVTRAIWEQVRAKLSLRFEDLGERPLRNIAEPVRIYRVQPSAAQGRAAVLTVTTSPNFAAKWLVPRLSSFAEAHGEIDLRISASMQHVNLVREDVDVAIRHGEGDWPGLHVTRLASEQLFPVCSPRLLRGRNALHEPADLARHAILHSDDQSNWERWLKAAGVDAGAAARGTVFNQASMAIDAAIDGQGVALARSALVAWDLRQGRLVRPFDLALPVPYAYWIVCPRSLAEQPKIAIFRDWLLGQSAGDASELAELAHRERAVRGKRTSGKQRSSTNRGPPGA